VIKNQSTRRGHFPSLSAQIREGGECLPKLPTTQLAKTNGAEAKPSQFF
jgi:hypothetical protein